MTSHVNISKPRSVFDSAFTSQLELVTLRAELALWKSRASTFEDDLNSIFERVANGEEIYLCQDNGEITYIGKVKSNGK